MRLTLRTLLAYLDDTLEPSQAKLIGQKLAESEAAQQLVERITQVTRRRRLTTPPASGPSAIDANTIADYLDNAVTPEQANEIEEICLSSDVHLAEVAACHQILTLILGEPANVPSSASQRAYGLVKGPEAIPFRKPAQFLPVAAPQQHAETRDLDETLRLGLPPAGRKDSWKTWLILSGGGLATACLLVFAIVQVLNPPGGNEQNPSKDAVAKGNQDKDQGPPDKLPTRDDAKPVDKKDGEEKKNGDKATTEPKEEKKDTEPKEQKDPKEPKEKGAESPSTEIPFGPPSARQTPIGHMISLDKKEPTILFQMSADKNAWKRVLPKKAESEVYSGRPLLSLPSIRSQVQLNNGLRLLLWGNMPEQVNIGLHESLVELFAHDKLDLDMALLRGRVVLTSTSDNAAMVRVRFEDPTRAIPEYVDITLQGKDTSVLVDRLCDFPMFPQNEPFYKDPKHANRQGPIAVVAFNVLSGTAAVKFGDVTHTLNAPPAPFQLVWNSRQGMMGPYQKPEVPSHLMLNPPLPKGLDPKVRKELVRVRGMLVEQLGTKSLDVVLTETMNALDIASRRLALRCYAAIDDLTSLVEAVENPNPVLIDVRHGARDALRQWIGSSRDNDYRLFDILEKKYKKKEAEIIMELLHGFAQEETKRPERYDLLIEYLTNRNQIIRELAAWHLYALAPAGHHIPYNATMDSETRNAAASAWRALIPSGQLPPTGPPLKK